MADTYLEMCEVCIVSSRLRGGSLDVCCTFTASASGANWDPALPEKLGTLEVLGESPGESGAAPPAPAAPAATPTFSAFGRLGSGGRAAKRGARGPGRRASPRRWASKCKRNCQERRERKAATCNLQDESKPRLLFP